MTAPYDVIVLGAGGVGSQALLALADRGARVLGIDRFAPPHDRGSTHGETRIIRLAYMEHPDYVPLLRRAYDGWAALEARTGRALYEQRGLLQVGPPEGHVVTGVLEAARIHDLQIDALDAAAARARWPGFAIPDHMQAVFERRAGFLWVERCVEAALDVARARGAELLTGAEVHRWRDAGEGLLALDTGAGTFTTRRLIVCPGAWAPALLGELGVPFTVKRKTLLWFDAPPDPRGPTWLFDTPQGVFYGFPSLPGSGLKAALHSGGEEVEDPLTVDRTIHDRDRAPVERLMAEHLTAPTAARFSRGAVCMYTMTPDENFIVDRHPADDRVVVVAGLSGHGFKLTPALGAIAAELALDGATPSPIGFLGLSRFRAR